MKDQVCFLVMQLWSIVLENVLHQEGIYKLFVFRRNKIPLATKCTSHVAILKFFAAALDDYLRDIAGDYPEEDDDLEDIYPEDLY